MANNTLFTRIKHKTDTYANWTAKNPVLLEGEIAIVIVPAESGAVQQEPAVLIKVGDGQTAFNALSFISGLAANVHNWALAAEKPEYQATEISGLDAYIAGKVQDTNTKYKIEAVPDDPYTYKLSYKELDGSWTEQDTITIPKDVLTEGTANGTVSFNGADVAVHGLGSAAYQDASAFATAEKMTEVEATANAAASKTYVDTELGKKANAADVYNKGEVDNKIAGAVSSVYKPAGSVAFAEIPTAEASVLGNVYNITDAFTTDDRFVEGAGKKHPAGTNVAVVKVGEEYKLDALSGFVDLSGYATNDNLSAGVQEAKTYADGLNTAMDGRMKAVEAEKHSHTNKNVLDGIDAGKVASWDAKANDADLAAIAKSGDVKDLKQTEGDYVIFDCGSATTVI